MKLGSRWLVGGLTFLLAVVWLQAAAFAQAPKIGIVESLAGGADFLRAGQAIPVTRDADVLQGDVVQTGLGGRVVIRFIDDSKVSIDEDSMLTMDELVFDPNAGGRMNLSAVQGVFVFVSGNIARASASGMTIRTPVMAIGVRGTGIGVAANPPGVESTATNLRKSDGTTGSFAAFNQGGLALVNQTNQQAYTTDNAIAPQTRIVQDNAVRDQFGGAAGGIGGGSGDGGGLWNQDGDLAPPKLPEQGLKREDGGIGVASTVRFRPAGPPDGRLEQASILDGYNPFTSDPDEIVPSGGGTNLPMCFTCGSSVYFNVDDSNALTTSANSGDHDAQCSCSNGDVTCSFPSHVTSSNLSLADPRQGYIITVPDHGTFRVEGTGNSTRWCVDVWTQIGN